MIQVAHQPSIGPTFHEPRYQPNLQPSSPILRQHIVRMIKTSNVDTVTLDLKRNESVRRPYIVLNRNHLGNRTDTNRELDEDTRQTSSNNASRKEAKKDSLERQTTSLSRVNSRRLPLRVQRHNTFHFSQQEELKKSEKENANLNNSLSSKESSTNNSCGVKGSAIQSPNYVSNQKKRLEMHKKSQKFSASLNEFKRRLMMNQNKFYPNQAAPVDQYKIDPTTPQTQIQPHPPLTPRSPYSKSSLTFKSLNEDTKLQVPDQNKSAEVSPIPSYRLPSREGSKQLHPVETYVVVQNQRERIRGKFDEPIALTMHNLSMHNMFIEMDERKKRDRKSATNTRIQKWIESVRNLNAKPLRSVRFNLASTDSSAEDSDSYDSY